MGDVDTSFSLYMEDRARKHKHDALEFGYVFRPREDMVECDYTYYPDDEDMDEIYYVVGGKFDIGGESLHKFLRALHDDDEAETDEALWDILDSRTYILEYTKLEDSFRKKAEAEFKECFEQQVPEDHRDDYIEYEEI